MQVYIWGTGNIAEEYLQQNELELDNIIGFIESKKRREIFYGKKVYEPKEIVDSVYDYIIVCINYYGRAILNTCKEFKIDTNKLILVDNWEWSDGTTMNVSFLKPCKKILENKINIEQTFPKLSQFIKEHDVENSYIVGKRNCFDFIDKTALMLSESFQEIEYQSDYFRYRTFELIANEIVQQNIKGNIAELGVFRGTFAKLINAKFFDRKLYLFDTFESFNEEEFQQERNQNRCPDRFYDVFKNTSVDSVVAIMEYPEQCIIKKGLFPDTAIGLENERYAFVSIDVDFEKSILEGLRYFYPRLNEGGAIFIHDFNNLILEGVRAAVLTYQKEIGHSICKVPIADWGGTLVVVK